MEPLTKATGEMIWRTEKEGSSIQRAMYTKANGKTTKLMVSVLSTKPMEQSTKVNGRMMHTTAKESKLGLMAPHLLENMQKERNMAKAS